MLTATAPPQIHTRQKLLNWGTFWGQEASKPSQEGWMKSKNFKGKDAESGPASDRVHWADLACWCIRRAGRGRFREVSSPILRGLGNVNLL